MDDGSWGYCEVLGLARDASDAWRIQLLWYDPGPPRAQREDWYLHDPAKLREPAAPDAERAHHADERGESGTEDQDMGEHERGHSGHHSDGGGQEPREG